MARIESEHVLYLTDEEIHVLIKVMGKATDSEFPGVWELYKAITNKVAAHD